MNAPVHADIIEQILQGEVPEPEAVTQQNKARAIEALALARNVQATFASPAGQATLAWLRRVTVEQPVFVPGIGERQYTGLDAVHQGFVREGQNSIYRELHRMMDLAQDPPKELVDLVEGDDHADS